MKSKILEIWEALRIKGKKNIRQRILYLLFACCFMTLLIAGAATFFGMLMMKNEAERVGIEIGETAAEHSNEAIKKVAILGLHKLVQERSGKIDERLEDLMWDATILSKEMTRIFQNPQDYKLRPNYAPIVTDAGIFRTYLSYLPEVNPADLTEEIGLAGNLQDLQALIFTESDGITGVYYASESGFIVEIAEDAGIHAGETTISYDSRQRTWYRKAVEENKTILTGVYADIQSRGFVITAAAPYYNSAGEILGVIAVDENAIKITDIVKQTTFGKTGYAFVMNNETGQVLFSPKAYEGTLSIDYNNNLEDDPVLFDNEDENLAAAARKMAAGESGVDLVNFDGKSYYLAYTPIKNANWSFGAVVEADEVTMPAVLSKKIIEDNTASLVEAMNSTTTAVMIARGFAFILMIILIPIVAQRVAAKFTEPILALKNGVQEIARGNFDKKLEIHAEKELEDLAGCVNIMTDEIKNYMKHLEKITSDKERIATELQVATNIQISMLPRNFDFGRKDFEIYATMNAAKEVGGDFYDFYLLDDNHLVITIADVSGKGVPAALFMANSKTILKNFALTMTNPDDLAAAMTLANNQLCDGNDEMMFVTVFMGMLDLKTGKFIFVNGGHNPPLVYRMSTDKFEYLKLEENIVLGMMDGMDFVQQEIFLEAGDMLYLYTDGVTEAMDENKNQYGEEQLLNCLNGANHHCNLQKLLATVREDLSEHVGAAEQSDDITMLAVRFDKERFTTSQKNL